MVAMLCQRRTFGVLRIIPKRPKSHPSPSLPPLMRNLVKMGYYIRTNRQELSDKDLWSLYIMLTRVEDAFRCLKSELGHRPVYHQKDRRMESHLFISVLAYHLMATILRELKQKGVNHRWETIRTQLATQVRITTSLTSDKGQRIHIRQTTDPEPFHYEIHRALGLPSKPLRTKRLRA